MAILHKLLGDQASVRRAKPHVCSIDATQATVVLAPNYSVPPRRKDASISPKLTKHRSRQQPSRGLQQVFNDLFVWLNRECHSNEKAYAL